MIRLPAPDVAFQGDQPVLMGFLSEAITADHQIIMSSPFQECIIFATISGRALSHRHQSFVENIYLNMSQDFWDRHQWISATLTQRMQILSLNYAPASKQTDPMLLFVNMIAQTTILYLYKVMKSVTPATAETQPEMMEYQHRSLAAAEEMATLTDTLVHLGCFKARSSIAPLYTSILTSHTGPSTYANPFGAMCRVLKLIP